MRSQPEMIYGAALYSARYAPRPGRYLVACYRADLAESPTVYRPAACFAHKSLAAAARRLAHMIAGRSYRGEKYDSLYIVTPAGDRLPLSLAREMIAAGIAERFSVYAIKTAWRNDRDVIASELDRLQRKIAELESRP